MDTQTQTPVVAPSVAPAAPAAEARGPGRPRKLTDAQLDRARKLYEDGWSVQKICNQTWCKVKPATLYYHFGGKSPVGDGVTEVRPRGRKGLSTEQLAFLVGKYQEGHTLSAIREMPEMKRKVRGKVKLWAAATLSAGLMEAGITPRRGRPAKPAEDESVEAVEAEPAAE